MMARLDKAGWIAVDAETADLIIVNSCGFIESAKQESINAVLGWRKLYPGKKILLAGCLAQRYAKELAEILPEADGLLGIEDIAGITGELAGQRPLLSLPGSAYVKISEGCDNRCSFCAIPLIRGSLASRDIPDIVKECRVLLERGIKELCIIGQDIGSFGADGDKTAASKLPELLQAISSLQGNFWVRLLYIHPDRFPLPLLNIMEKDSRFLPYFDIPFQHASPEILAAMNRRGTAENYLALLETIRGRLPGAVIRSTFLLGFPGETEKDFAALLDFQEKAKFDWLGCFTYSREEGTAAYAMKGRVPAKTAKARRQIIEERQIPITEKNMDRFVGQTLDVLIEEQISGAVENVADNLGLNEGFWLGRLYCQAPEIDGAAVLADNDASKNLKAGDIVPCKVIARRGFDLEVSLV